MLNDGLANGSPLKQQQLDSALGRPQLRLGVGANGERGGRPLDVVADLDRWTLEEVERPAGSRVGRWRQDPFGARLQADRRNGDVGIGARSPRARRRARRARVAERRGGACSWSAQHKAAGGNWFCITRRYSRFPPAA